MRAVDSDLISLKDIEEEFINNCGFVKVKQLLVKGPSGKLYLVEGDEGIRTLHEPYYVECEYGTDAESESDNSLVDPGSDIDDYNFDELERIKMQKSMKVNDNLSHYKELHMSMTFKDLDETRKIVNLFALANKKSLIVDKSDTKRLRYKCIVGCPFAHLISLVGKDPGFKVKTLKIKHNCESAFVNLRATISTLAQYFKSKIQNNSKYKLKDMRQDLRDHFNLSTNSGDGRLFLG
ncbi:hypothetical protein RND71_006087 [Anisodus tanguticus]|uniref:Transposase MuDR plant domain-containing protein n=1 Tax=Anisodus tanguticus TaxID=243964 RepID=A0AAE1STA0_9SOLA|nr:hypothetical protein RND71_006087 [Anisodus tanguticus]